MCYCICNSDRQLFASPSSPLVSKSPAYRPQSCVSVWPMLTPQCTGWSKLVQIRMYKNPLRSRKPNGSISTCGIQKVTKHSSSGSPGLALLQVSSLYKRVFSQTDSFKNKAGRGSQIQVSVSPLYFQNLSPSVSQGVVSIMSVIYESMLWNTSSLQKQALTGTWTVRFKGLLPVK